MKLRNVVLVVAVSALFAGCSMFERKQVDYKAGAAEATQLEVPPDLTVPETEQRYLIPGRDGEKVARYSEYAKQAMEQPCLAPASAPAATTPVSAPAAKLQETDGGKRIQLEEPFDRGWRRVGLALERAHIAVTDKDRSKGIYFVAVPGKDKKKPADYQVVVRETREGSEVAVVDAQGKGDTEAARLTETIYKNLEK